MTYKPPKISTYYYSPVEKKSKTESEKCRFQMDFAVRELL